MSIFGSAPLALVLRAPQEGWGWGYGDGQIYSVCHEFIWVSSLIFCIFLGGVCL